MLVNPRLFRHTNKIMRNVCREHLVTILWKLNSYRLPTRKKPVPFGAGDFFGLPVFTDENMLARWKTLNTFYGKINIETHSILLLHTRVARAQVISRAQQYQAQWYQATSLWQLPEQLKAKLEQPGHRGGCEGPRTRKSGCS